ncbi:MAG: T9SS type A sorting domain-containing protein, partial [Ignavibacteria bacterium]|nr:T9SS type A sorting domain-containing protein [Ignavibacteria bacterium]
IGPEEEDGLFISDENEIPKEYSLKQNYPNPFNPNTNIQYDLPTDNFVTIKIYNVLGKEIATLINENKTAGRYIVSFNASKYPSGIYYYKIKAGSYEAIRKMMLIK